MNSKLVFDFHKNSSDTKLKNYFYLDEPVLSVLHTNLVPEYFEGECVPDVQWIAKQYNRYSRLKPIS
jgi:hypothetical protein